mgnify:CR=1 FL=1
MQNDINLHCCCFTGHRPEKLKYSEEEIKPLLADAIDCAIADGYTTFITGMAPGTDIWAAELVLEKKKQNGELCLICAVPPRLRAAQIRARGGALQQHYPARQPYSHHLQPILKRLLPAAQQIYGGYVQPCNRRLERRAVRHKKHRPLRGSKGRAHRQRSGRSLYIIYKKSGHK